MKFFPKIETQLSVFAENKPGRLAKICSALGDNGVNIYSVSVHDTVDHSIIRLIVDNATKALILLEEEGLYIITHKVVTLVIDNKPGSLAAVASKIAMADQNIEYAYCTAFPDQDCGMLVIKAEDPERVQEVLESS